MLGLAIFIIAPAHPHATLVAVYTALFTTKWNTRKTVKQGQIHGYPNRVRMGRGNNEIDQLGSWVGAVIPKPPVNAEKAKCYKPTNGPTDNYCEF